MAAPLTLVLRTSSLKDSLASTAQIIVEFDWVDAGVGGGGISVEMLSKVEKLSLDAPKSICPHVLRTSMSITSSSTARQLVQIAVEYDEIRGDGGKLVIKKVGELSKSPKNLKGLKILQRPSIWKNVYQSTDLPSIRFEL